MDELKFRVKIWAITLPCKVTQLKIFNENNLFNIFVSKDEWVDQMRKPQLRLQKTPKHITQLHPHVIAPVRLAISFYHVQRSAAVPSDLLQGIAVTTVRIRGGWRLRRPRRSHVIRGPWLVMIYDDGLWCGCVGSSVLLHLICSLPDDQHICSAVMMHGSICTTEHLTDNHSFLLTVLFSPW